MDSKVFEELQDKGVVTMVGLNPDNYTDIKDLQDKQLATGIGDEIIYADAIAGDTDNETIDPTDDETTVYPETPTEPEVVDPVVDEYAE